MTLGSVQPGMQVVVSLGKSTSAPITKGAICVQDTATSPDSWKIAPASAGGTGPFCVCVNEDAATAAPAFAGCFFGLVTMKAQGAIEVGKAVSPSATVAGSVAAAGTGDILGVYLGHENELTGKTPGTAAADGESNIVVFVNGGVVRV